MAVDELLGLIDKNEEVASTISEESFQAMQDADPEFADKLVMSNYIGERSGLNPSEVFDNYEATSKSHGYSGTASLDRATARGNQKRASQFNSVGYWKSAAGSVERGGVRASQFTDSMGTLLAQSKIDGINEELTKRQELVDFEPKNEQQRRNKEFLLKRSTGREEFLLRKKTEWEATRNEQIIDYTRKQAKILSIPVSKALNEFRQAEGIEGVKKLFNPSVLTQVIAEELVASTPSLALTIGGGITGGLPGAAGAAGVGEMAQGISNNFYSYLQTQGVNTSNQDSVLKALEDSDLFNEAMDFAMTKSAPEAIASALSVGVATKGKPLVNALLIQPGLAGVGVVSSNLIVGEDIDIKELATEMVAEMGTGSVEVGLARMLNRSQSFKDKTLTESGQPMNQQDFALASQSIDTDTHTEGMSQEEAFVVEKARDGSKAAVDMIENIHEASVVADKIGLTGDKKIIGLTKAESAKTRDAQGLEPLPANEIQSQQGQLDLAKQEGFDAKATTIASEILSNPRQLSTKEFSGFVLKKTQLEVAINNLDVQIVKAQDSNADVSRLRTKQAILEKEVALLDEAATRSGTEGARAQSIRRLMINTEDFSIERLVSKAEAAKGSKLTESEKSILEKAARKIETLKTQIRLQNAIIQSLSEGKVDQKVIDELVRLKVLEVKEKNAIKKNLERKGWKRKFKETRAVGIPGQIAIEFAAASRTMRTIGDVSAFLRQGRFLVTSNPIQAFRGMRKSFTTLFSEANHIQIDMLMRDNPNQVVRDASELYMSPVDRSDLSKREEAFASNVVESIPGLRHVAFASERNMTTFLNVTRVAKFDSFIENHPEASREVKTAVAHYINSATGRGSLGDFERSARALSVLFFAPRFAVSRIQHVANSAALLKHKETRAMVIKDWATFMGTGISLLSLAALASGVKVGDDPLESDFGKLVIGDTRVDTWGGFQQPFRLFFAWLAKGAETADLVELEKDIDVADATMRFMLYKASPLVTIPAEIVQGEDVIGRERHIAETLVDSITPLFLADTLEVYNNTGSIEKSIATLGLTSVGVGVSEQAPRKKKSQKRAR